MKRQNSHLYILVFALVCGMLPAILGMLPAVSTRYVSEWRVLRAGGVTIFDHGLGVIPAEVSALAGKMNGKAMPDEAMPYSEWAGLQVTVSATSITMRNDGETDVMVRVAAER